MKPTNDRAIIRLIHMPTGHSVDWVISRAVMPSVHYINERVESIREELKAFIDRNGVNLEDKKINEDHLKKIREYNLDIMRLKLDALACVVEPKDAIPAVYSSKREYLEQCIGSYNVISSVMDFFSKLSISSIESPEGSLSPVQFLTANGEPWESETTKGPTGKESSTD